MKPMTRKWTSIATVGGTLVLLAVFGFLQYRWQTRISASDAEKMQARLEEDVSRFSGDFNREIQNAYFNFQMTEAEWNTPGSAQFLERFRFWQSKALYPKLIKEFFYFDGEGKSPAVRYDPTTGVFTTAEENESVRILRSAIRDGKAAKPIHDEISTLFLPVRPDEKRVERVMLKRSASAGPPPEIKLPPPAGYLAIVLDGDVITKEILPALAQKHFGSGDYRLSVTDAADTPKFELLGGATNADAESRMYDLSPDNFVFFGTRELISKIGENTAKGSVIEQQLGPRIMKRTESVGGTTGTVTVELKSGDPQKTTMITRTGPEEAPWKLRAEHTSGSIAAYVEGVRRRNLAIGFGLLTLLGAAVLAIFVSSQKARLHARRQLEFVSSVSHEFRTPLAVIYSAGENLADGVTKDDTQIVRYGTLIKNEGRKLSAMVEQILEYAGSRTTPVYHLEPTSVEKVVADALADCKPVLDADNVQIETSVPSTLPRITADKAALSRAIQNLIVNSVKYSNGEKWVRVTAENGSGSVRISVEDRGIGISKGDLRSIFEPFFRSRSVVDAQIHGNGLGLSVVRQIVEAHGGTVSAVSKENFGSTFTIKLPVEKGTNADIVG
jgi:signal transduction histidine kinase